MRIRYFLVNDSGQLERVAQRVVEGAWKGKRRLDDWPGDRDLGIITVLCDNSFRPAYCLHARVHVVDGEITEDSIRNAVRVWVILKPVPDLPGFSSTSRDEVWDRPEVIYQYSGWPEPDDVRRQLAVALDVLPEEVPDMGLGGPLLASVQLGISIRQAASYFNTAVPGKDA